MTKKQFVQSERQFTVDLLKGLSNKQWQASTLCKGWTVEDLAAHLVTRERNMIGGIGLVVPGLHFLHDKQIARVKHKGHQYIIGKLQHYPWWMPAVLNQAEFWVHNEDFLRAGLHMSRPHPKKDESKLLWESIKGLARVKKDMVADMGELVLKSTDLHETLILHNSKSPKTSEVTGRSGELLLFFYGRRVAAQVTIVHKNNGKS